MSQSEGPRIISKFIEGVKVNYQYSADAGAVKWTFDVANGTAHTGWSLVDPTSNSGILQWTGYIDITGYRPDDMVLVPSSVTCQRGANMVSGAMLSGGVFGYGGEIFMQYALTTDKVDDIDFGVFESSEPLVGFLTDNSEMEQVIYSVTENWTPTSAGGGMNLTQKHVAGDGFPIVGPRIYVTVRVLLGPRSIGLSTPVDTGFGIPPMRFVIAGDAIEVKEFELLHLMKRQIDLQQTPDVDV